MGNLAERVYRAVGRHIVTLSCLQTAETLPKPKLLIFSGFLVDVEGMWFYVTAGHILSDIRKALAAGSTFDVWRLGDYTAGAKFKGVAIPYHFELDNWLAIHDEANGLDYAAVPISDLYRRLLAAGDATPIGKEAWGTYVDENDGWALVGIPSESIDYDDETLIKARVVVAPLVLAPIPVGAEAKSENQFYARFADDPTPFVKDIDGMSGAPIFSLRKEGEEWKYKVIGVQSGWYKSSKVLAACPFSSFGQALSDVVIEAKRLYAEMANGPGNGNVA